MNSHSADKCTTSKKCSLSCYICKLDFVWEVIEIVLNMLLLLLLFVYILFTSKCMKFSKSITLLTAFGHNYIYLRHLLFLYSRKQKLIVADSDLDLFTNQCLLPNDGSTSSAIVPLVVLYLSLLYITTYINTYIGMVCQSLFC